MIDANAKALVPVHWHLFATIGIHVRAHLIAIADIIKNSMFFELIPLSFIDIESKREEKNNERI